MANTPKPRPLGYPSLERVQRGCQYIAQTQPRDAYQTCVAKLHNPSKATRAALEQVFKINTLAACWMLRDIEQHRPIERFACFRKPKSTHYLTDQIAQDIERSYRQRVLSRYTLNSELYTGLSVTLASMISGYLQKMTDAQERGLLEQFKQSADFVMPATRYYGKRLGSLGRKTIYGFAFLTPKREQCEEALAHLNVLLAEDDDDSAALANAKSYRMPFGPRRNKPLGAMQNQTLRRLRGIAERYLADAETNDLIRAQAQQYLLFTPPNFPHLKQDGLSPQRKHALETQHFTALDDFAALPSLDEEPIERNLASHEKMLFRQLMHLAYAHTNKTEYLPLRWTRADAPSHHRACGLVYDPKRKRYLFLAYLFAAESRHRRPLTIKGQLFDVNNPSTPLTTSSRPNAARLFELEFAEHHLHQLDQAREDAERWKDAKHRSSGAVRVATLHAHFSEEQQEWWFEVHLSLGIRPTHHLEPLHVLGVHIDRIRGWYFTLANLDGTIVLHGALDEIRIADVLQNRFPAEQAHVPPAQRTTKERHHRIADAIVALTRKYQAQLGIENVRGAAQQINPAQQRGSSQSPHAIIELIPYKLARLNLPPFIDIWGIAPRRDCGLCGTRHSESVVVHSMFQCPACEKQSDRYANTTQEVVRRTLWVMAQHKAPKNQPENLNKAVR